VVARCADGICAAKLALTVRRQGGRDAGDVAVTRTAAREASERTRPGLTAGCWTGVIGYATSTGSS